MGQTQTDLRTHGHLVKRVTAIALILGATATAYSGDRHSAGVRPRPVTSQSAHASSGRADVEFTTQEVQAIKSLAQLRKVTPAAVIQGWQIRFGVADLPDKGRPWLLLYCHVRRTGQGAGAGPLAPPTQMYTGAALLGPVSFVVTTSGSLGARKKVKVAAPKIPAAGLKDVERLFVAAIPVAGKQATYIFVHSGDAGTIIARWQRPADAQARAHPWLPFAAAAEKGFIVADEFQAARPTYPRRAPLWRLVQGESFTLPRPIAGKLVRYFLPGCVRGDAPYYEPRYYNEKTDTGVKRKEPQPLKLAISDGAFVVASKVELANRPDEYLLARWWVNDKAVVAPAPKAGVQTKKARADAVSKTKEMKVALRLPTYLGTLKAGDEVILQVMHCDGGYSRLGGEAVAQLVKGWPAFGPMLSNELTFTVTKEMLSKGTER